VAGCSKPDKRGKQKKGEQKNGSGSSPYGACCMQAPPPPPDALRIWGAPFGGLCWFLWGRVSFAWRFALRRWRPPYAGVCVAHTACAGAASTPCSSYRSKIEEKKLASPAGVAERTI
jgi:hypothetical protein